MENYYETFIEFLTSKGAYEDFMELLGKKECNAVSVKTFEETLIAEYSWVVEDVISISFIWNSTPQGQEYWQKLSEEWREHIKRLTSNV